MRRPIAARQEKGPAFPPAPCRLVFHHLPPQGAASGFGRRHVRPAPARVAGQTSCLKTGEPVIGRSSGGRAIRGTPRPPRCPLRHVCLAAFALRSGHRHGLLPKEPTCRDHLAPCMSPCRSRLAAPCVQRRSAVAAATRSTRSRRSRLRVRPPVHIRPCELPYPDNPSFARPRAVDRRSDTDPFRSRPALLAQRRPGRFLGWRPRPVPCGFPKAPACVRPL